MALKSGVNAALAGVDVTSTQSMTAALYGLDAAQQKVALSALKRAGANTTELESNLANLSGIKLLSAAKANEIVTNNLLTKDAEKNILTQINSAAADNLKKFGVDGVTQAELKRILATNGVTGAEAESIVSSYAATTAKTVEAGATNVLTAALWNNIKALAIWLVTNPVGWCVLAAGAIYGVSKAYDALTVSVEEHQQMLDDAKSSYNDTSAKVESLNTQLTDTKSKISELEGYDKLSFTDQQELEKLKAKNDELQREIDLQNQLRDAKQQDVNKQFADTMGADVGKTGEYQSSFQNEFIGNTGGVAQYRAKNIDEMQYASEQVKVYENAVKNYKKYQAELDQAKVDGNENAEKLAQKQVDIYKKQSEDSQKYLDQRIADLVATADGVTEDESTKPYLDFINNLRDRWAITYNEMSGDTDAWAQSQDDAFNRVASNSDFSSLVKGAQKAGSNLDLTQDKYKDFIQALIDSGFIANDSAENLKKVADAINDIGESSNKLAALDLAKSLSETTTVLSQYEATFDSFFSNGEVTDNFKSLFGDNKTDEEIKEQISKTFSSASDSVQTGIFDIIKRVRDGKEDYQSAMSDFALVGANEINSIGDQLASALTSSAFGDLDGLDGMIDSWTELSSTLKETASCMDLVKSAQEEMNATGSISISTALDLISKNSDYADILKIDTNGAISLVDNAEQVLIGTKINAIKASAQQQLADARAAVKSLESAEKFKDTAQTIKNDVIPVYSAFSGSAAYLGSIFSDIFSGNFSGILDRAKTSMQSALNEANSKIVDISKDSGELVQARKDLEDATKFNNIAQNLTIDNFSKKYSPTSTTSSKDTNSKNTNSKDIEEYVADIDKLYSGKEKLVEIQNEIKRLSSINDITDSDVEKVQNLNQIIILYKQEQDALHALNQERKNVIAGQVSTLMSQGFDVLYDPNENKLVINNLEHINKLQGKTTDETNEIRKAAEKLISTVQSENDDAIQTSQDWLNVLKDINGAYDNIKQSAQDALDTAKEGLESTVSEALDQVSELLNKEKESYETQKSNMEAVASTVTSYLNDYISSLQEENDELEKQISLQEKLESLDKARTQRNKRVFKQGEGFVWESDQSAVREAQSTYDSALRQYNLDEQIQELQDYIDAWNDAVNSYETKANESLTKSMFGSHWRSNILRMDYWSVSDFKKEYTGVLKELDKSVYGSVAYQISNLEDLKDEWDDTVDKANDTSINYNQVLELINTYESGNYSKRRSSLSTFVSDAISQYESLAAAAAASASVPVSPSGIDRDDAIAQMKKNGAAWGSASAEGKDALADANLALGSSLGWSRDHDGVWHDETGAKAFANGGIVDYTGVAAVHGGQAAELMLNNKDVSRLYDYIHSGDVLAQSAENLLVSSSLSAGNSIAPNSDQNITFNMGDVNVSGVQDVNGVADEIVKKLPMAVLQKIYSKKKRR